MGRRGTESDEEDLVKAAPSSRQIDDVLSRPNPNTPARWYVAGPQELNSPIRWLDGISNDFKENRVVREQWKEDMDVALGASLTTGMFSTL